MNTEIVIVLVILALTVVLLVTDKLRIDVIAILCMLALAWTGILEPFEALSGFASNAVIAMLSVMILGRGIAKTGLMDRFSRFVLRAAGKSRNRIIAVVSASVGLMSGIIQNIGAAVLFLPSILNIARRMKIPPSSLIMPIGFAAILGGTLTMVGSGPLILVNDLLKSASLEPYNLFAVTPVGLILLLAGIVFFFIFGRLILPRHINQSGSGYSQEKLIQDWSLPATIYHYSILRGSSLIGKSLEETGIWDKYQLNILALVKGKTPEYAPWRHTQFETGQVMALLGTEESIIRFSADFGLKPETGPGQLKTLNDPVSAGFAEVIIPPRSAIAGQTLRSYNLRKRHGIEPVILYHHGSKVEGDFSDIELTPGDMLVVHGLWDRVAELKKGHDFILATPLETEVKNRSMAWIAVACFAFAIGLTFAGFPISISFFTGAIAMVLTRVISIDEAYEAIDWKVVFFLAGLIPLGVAMQKTGTAAWIAGNVMAMIAGSHTLVFLLVVAVMTTVFSLFMSNVAATVILAPLVISMAQIGSLDPRPLVLLVAVASANSFMLPTHQVNALLKTPGNYRNADYLKAGGAMTLLFLVCVVLVFYFLYI